ncbi:GNAT family N-acetyltransferase [Candidatus Micrarchaeota archaeon]|nr:GNAT family N-acetyltransferase [Candidatus Micrarchaeota archaeon]
MPKYEIKIIKSGREFLKIGTAKEFMDYINPFVEDKTYILMENPISLKEEKQWFKNEIKSLDSGIVLKLILLADGKLAGISEGRKGTLKNKYNVTFGLSVSKQHRGKGFGKKLLIRCIQESKKYFKPRKMWIEYISGNEVAKNLYESVGFVEVATLKEYVNHFGKWLDRVIMEYRG